MAETWSARYSVAVGAPPLVAEALVPLRGALDSEHVVLVLVLVAALLPGAAAAGPTAVP